MDDHRSTVMSGPPQGGAAGRLARVRPHALVTLGYVLVAAAGPLVGCGSGESLSTPAPLPTTQIITGQTVTPSSTVMPIATPIPPNVGLPSATDVSLTEADNGRTIYIRREVNVHIVLNQPSQYPFYAWTPLVSSDEQLLVTRNARQSAGSSSGDFDGVGVGQAALTARTMASCEPSCHPPIRQWGVVIQVVAG